MQLSGYTRYSGGGSGHGASMSNDSFIHLFFDKSKRLEALNRSRDGEKWNGNLMFRSDTLYSFGEHFPLAIELPSGGYLLNGEVYSVTTSHHQSLVRRSCQDLNVEIPLAVLGQAEVDPWNIRIIDTSEPTYRTYQVKDPKTGELLERQEHLLGACLFEFEGRYFLSSADSSAHWRFGYFLTELPDMTATVNGAFELLKPDQVKQAEKDGIEVHRQGEWFFIRYGSSKEVRSELKDYMKEQDRRLNGEPLFPALCPAPWSLSQFISKNELLPASDSNREPHHQVRDALRLPDRSYALVRGTVRHTGNEHRMLKLGNSDWYFPVSNVQIRSWSGQGKID